MRPLCNSLRGHPNAGIASWQNPSNTSECSPCLIPGMPAWPLPCNKDFLGHVNAAVALWQKPSRTSECSHCLVAAAFKGICMRPLPCNNSLGEHASLRGHPNAAIALSRAAQRGRCLATETFQDMRLRPLPCGKNLREHPNAAIALWQQPSRAFACDHCLVTTALENMRAFEDIRMQPLPYQGQPSVAAALQQKLSRTCDCGHCLVAKPLRTSECSHCLVATASRAFECGDCLVATALENVPMQPLPCGKVLRGHPSAAIALSRVSQRGRCLATKAVQPLWRRPLRTSARSHCLVATAFFLDIRMRPSLCEKHFAAIGLLQIP